MDVPEWVFQIPAKTGFVNKISAGTGVTFILFFTFQIKVETGAAESVAILYIYS